MVEKLTRQDVQTLIGSTSDVMLAEILDIGATRAELVEAWAWLENDEAMLNDGRPIPSGRVAALVDILRARDEEELPSVPKL
jgi:hypothetical protein